MLAAAGAGPGPWWDPGTQSSTPSAVARIQFLEPSPAASPGLHWRAARGRKPSQESASLGRLTGYTGLSAPPQTPAPPRVFFFFLICFCKTQGCVFSESSPPLQKPSLFARFGHIPSGLGRPSQLPVRWVSVSVFYR